VKVRDGVDKQCQERETAGPLAVITGVRIEKGKEQLWRPAKEVAGEMTAAKATNVIGDRSFLDEDMVRGGWGWFAVLEVVVRIAGGKQVPQ
jgi:hypothetical protein